MEFEGSFFLAVFFRVTHDGPSDRRTTRSVGHVRIEIPHPSPIKNTTFSHKK